MASLLHAWLLLTLTVVSFQEEMNETVICTTDHMEVVIPSAFFLHKVPPVYVWDLHLNDPDCRGVEVGDDYVFSIKSNLSRCGSVMTSDATHILFINTIHSNHSDVITRNYINITFVCRYPVSYMVQQPNGENMIRVDVRTIMLNTEDGNFSVSMLLYKDEAFADQWTAVPSLTLDDHVFVKVFMIPTHLMLRMERCWATPTRDPYSHIQYTFIRDSCPVLTDRRTLSVLKNGRGAEAAFGIQMFKFVGSSYTNVFLHCNVRICHGALGLCQPNCSAEDVSTRTRRDVPLSHTVSYGPIRRRPDDGESPPFGGLPPVETFILGGLLVVLLLLTGVLGRLWIRSRRFYPAAREAQLTLSNVQHISEVAS
ncbi:pancreatic secretory granule membrane major glycoprotein GP2 isoform X2 [Syngnathoides biaculeatus]|uniref:pancreatic secretory granule membrane major glycoprotein GP2 isoform X2 n=1 Tax=Syngnathoides biaculeatus TaxID=300417 RepID=UPI002ADE41AB|nr:pancreatic secretory granule membrane major glycoprotein GP2 isoform X2 [Syngnathoides biaculeatus]XP_061700968.1 pancreatic secretory granule membrane major glycoprotein GP2 isoform X2 [Syngnathoides biaculeatus]